jgi:RNA polymerase sigma factor (sigma-70 family)
MLASFVRNRFNFEAGVWNSMILKRYLNDGLRKEEDPSRATDIGSSASESDRFGRRFKDFQPYLLELCRKLLPEREDARDAVSETCLRAYAARKDFDGANFAGWLSTIAKNICIDWIRRKGTARNFDAGIDLVVTDSEMRILTAIQIRSIFSRLPEPQRCCLMLFYIEGHSAKEVAEKTGFTTQQVNAYLQNGRRNFKRAWKALENRDA